MQDPIKKIFTLIAILFLLFNMATGMCFALLYYANGNLNYASICGLIAIILFVIARRKYVFEMLFDYSYEAIFTNDSHPLMKLFSEQQQKTINLKAKTQRHPVIWDAYIFSVFNSSWQKEALSLYKMYYFKYKTLDSAEEYCRELVACDYADNFFLNDDNLDELDDMFLFLNCHIDIDNLEKFALTATTRIKNTSLYNKTKAMQIADESVKYIWGRLYLLEKHNI